MSYLTISKFIIIQGWKQDDKNSKCKMVHLSEISLSV